MLTAVLGTEHHSATSPRAGPLLGVELPRTATAGRDDGSSALDAADVHVGAAVGYNVWMVPFRQYSFSATGIRSLCWRGDELVDWVGGGRAFALDGQEQRASVFYAYHFDAPTALPDGRFAVIYER